MNLSEVYAKLADAGGSEDKIAHAIGVLHLRVEPFDAEHAKVAGSLRPATKAFSPSLGDRACLAVARVRSATALTADRVRVELPEALGISVRLLR